MDLDGTIKNLRLNFSILPIYIYIFYKTFPAFYVLMQSQKPGVYGSVFSYINKKQTINQIINFNIKKIWIVKFNN